MPPLKEEISSFPFAGWPTELPPFFFPLYFKCELPHGRNPVCPLSFSACKGCAITEHRLSQKLPQENEGMVLLFCSQENTGEKSLQTWSTSWQRSLMSEANAGGHLWEHSLGQQWGSAGIQSHNRNAWKLGRSCYRCTCKTYGELASYYNQFLQQFINTLY